MSANAPSFRLPIALPKGTHPEMADILQNHDDSINDLQAAIPELKSQIDALKPSTPASSSTTENVTSTSETTVIASNVIGFVNDQTGQTAYATQQADYGAFILLSDASPIAVTLTVAPVITLPWFATLINTGAGTATLTPVTGTINGNADFTLLGGQVVTIVFDGTNFSIFPLLALPQSIAEVTSEWLDSYDATTGAFTQSQPAFSDVSGSATAAQVPALSALTGQITEAQLPSAGLTVVITTAALTSLGAQGSQTFVNGILTSQVQAT